ncbi:MAG: GDSL-type esterase/lipase family protein [Opitutaceae bacterium]|jgi:lysophospholipase L1-like esterase
MLKSIFVCVLALLSLCSTPTAIALEELAPRGGLPNVHARLSAGEPVRVAFLGGSITAAQGWRVLVRDHLKAAYPKSALTEISAAIPGTDSAFGACRLADHVLARSPDLLFVEFAVNDIGAAPDRIRAAMEGIVRQTWRADPRTDIVFVYTLSQSQLPDLQAGRPAATSRAMEEVAAHYGIPSIQFGVEVARQADAGKLLFKGLPAGLDAEGRDSAGRLVFSADGTHPLPAGHRLYFSVIDRALPRLLTGDAAPHVLPAALTSAPWDTAAILPVEKLTRTGNWSLLPSLDKRTAWQPANLTPPTWLATAPGSSTTFTFTGTSFGLAGLKTPDSGRFRVTVDDRPSVETTFFDAFCVDGHSRLAAWWYPGDLPAGPHTVHIELLDTPIGKAAILATRAYAPGNPATYAGLNLYLSGILLPRTTP